MPLSDNGIVLGAVLVAGVTAAALIGHHGSRGTAPAWFGATEDLLAALKQVDADTDAKGYKISGENVIMGLGGDEIIVPEGTRYYVGGKSHSLADLMRKKGKGVSPMLITGQTKKPRRRAAKRKTR
jgi:hypothetical protein